jgi:hypothetical protein
VDALAKSEMHRVVTFHWVADVSIYPRLRMIDSTSRHKDRIKRRSIRFPGISLHYTLTTLQHTSIMPKSCIICSAVASPEIMLQYCAACQSTLYCSRACQRKDWNTQHKQICKLLNVGYGDRQMCIDIHTSFSRQIKEHFETNVRNYHEDDKQFFKLFEESTFEGSRAAARKMKKIIKRQYYLMLHSLRLLVRSSNSEMFSWPNSPLLVLLQFVEPSVVLFGDEAGPLQGGVSKATPLHQVSNLADSFDYSTHVNQLILAKQLIEHGAIVNAVSIPHGETPLHTACFAGNVTNLDFVELLLERGLDQNTQDHTQRTPLLCTTPFAPGAAIFLLNLPTTTDVNTITRSGASFLARVREAIGYRQGAASIPDPAVA